uniref:ATP-dependent Clp protease proteolytic subunit n=1 Tax=Macrostomum lignano TaxID=282301 RepID=A0A1I8G424_9PLAT
MFCRSIISRTLSHCRYRPAPLATVARPGSLQQRRCYMVPIVIEQDGRNERAYDVYSRLLKDRIVCLMGPVSQELSNAVIAQLLFLQSDSPKSTIHVYINSPGGSVTAGLAIYDTMQYVASPVATYCLGEACSMGSLLLQAGSPGKRFALPNSRVMIHQPLGSAGGQATDMQIHVAEILRMKTALLKIYAKHTGQPESVLAEAMERDRFMSPTEAVQFGLIDSVLEKPPEKAEGEPKSS